MCSPITNYCSTNELSFSRHSVTLIRYIDWWRWRTASSVSLHYPHAQLESVLNAFRLWVRCRITGLKSMTRTRDIVSKKYLNVNEKSYLPSRAQTNHSGSSTRVLGCLRDCHGFITSRVKCGCTFTNFTVTKLQSKVHVAFTFVEISETQGSRNSLRPHINDVRWLIGFDIPSFSTPVWDKINCQLITNYPNWISEIPFPRCVCKHILITSRATRFMASIESIMWSRLLNSATQEKFP